jgi:predicted TPR repeat methyltransferase
LPIHDDWYGEVDPQMLEMLSRLAGGGKALELEIETGRVALPMAQSGVKMYGIDSSPAMLQKLRSKPGADQILLNQGNFVNIPFEEKFDLIFVVFSTIYGLLTQEDQIRCFQSVANHLESKGLFVIEAFVPDFSRYQEGNQIGLLTWKVNKPSWWLPCLIQSIKSSPASLWCSIKSKRI